MELRAVEMLRLHVIEEIDHSRRRSVRIELDANLAGGGVELDLRVRTQRGQGERASRHRGGGEKKQTAHHGKAPENGKWEMQNEVENEMESGKRVKWAIAKTMASPMWKSMPARRALSVR